MSVFTPKTLTLKDGAKVTLRSPEEDDAPRLIDYLDAVRRETDFILFSPDDDLPELEWERNWVRSNRDGAGVQIMAEADGEVVSLCGIGCGGHERVRHRGDIGISVRQAWCDRGLGTLLMHELVGWAEQSDAVDVLTLGVFADNPRAIRVYEKAGFAVDGRRRWQTKRGDDYVDELIMSRWVGRGPEPVGDIEPVAIPLGEDAVLRTILPGDAEALFELYERNREHLRPWFRWAPSVTCVREVRAMIGQWLGASRETGAVSAGIEVDGNLVGMTYMIRHDVQNRRVELGYWLDADAVGRGYITKACRALIDYAFTRINVNRIDIAADVNNQRSQNVAERLGFTREAVIRQWLRFPDGRFVDMASYCLLRSEWAATGKAVS